LSFLTQTLQDFLASFPYIKWHRSLISFIKVRYSTLRCRAGFFFGLTLYQVGWNGHIIMDRAVSRLCVAVCPNGLP